MVDVPFAAAFFVLFSTMTFLYKIANGAKSNLLDILALLINAGVFYAVSYELVSEVFGSKAVAVVTLSLAAFYTAHVFMFLQRRLIDRELLVTFIGLAAFFLSVTVPLVISSQWLTAAWSLQALVLLWIACRLGSQFLRHVSYLLYGIVLFRFAGVDLLQQFGPRPWAAPLETADYLRLLAERAVMFGIPIGSLACAYRLLNRHLADEPTIIDRANDVSAWINERMAVRMAIGAFVAMLFVYLHLEIDKTVGFFYAPVKLPMLTLLWLAMCGLLLYEATARGSEVILGLFALFAVGLALKLVAFDLPSWNATERFLYYGPYSPRDALLRLLDFGSVTAFFGVAYALLAGRPRDRNVGVFLGFCSLGLLFVYLTLEVNTFLHAYLDGIRTGGISILWSLFALGLILRGIIKNARALRYLGLALFAVVAWKVFFVDLVILDQFYRIIAFIALGLLALCGSFLYLRFRESFALDEDSPVALEIPAASSRPSDTPTSSQEPKP